ncbi:MAG: arylsulfatase [Planctomycetota bacterium]
MHTFVMVLAFVILGLVGTLAAAETQSRPNIILIVADDLGYGDVSCYGQKRFTTPHIDRLANEGIRFTQAYAGSTVCAPSRCSLFTGLHTGHAVVRGNKPSSERDGFASNTPLPEGTVTWPALLAQSGYATGMFGKWGLGAPGNSGEPAKMGLAEFLGYCDQTEAHDYYPSFLVHNREKMQLAAGTWSHAVIWDGAMDFVRKNRNGPFVILCTVTVPHAKLQVPEADSAPFLTRYADLQGQAKIDAAAYAGMITRLDADIGRLLELLQKEGLDKKTLVAFTSDNGPAASGQPLGYFNSSGGLRGIKRDLYEGGIRTPLVVRWPGRIAAGQTSDLSCAFWDWMPTACALAGVKAPTDGDGISFLPTLLGKAAEQKRHDSLYWEFFEKGTCRAVRFGDWKAVQAGFVSAPDGPVELFDLAKDPSEKTDVAAANPAIIAQARKLLTDSRTAAPAWEGGGTGEGKGKGKGKNKP